jgi:hypothetical protein
MSDRNLLTLALAGWITCGLWIAPTKAQDAARMGDAGAKVNADDESSLQTTAFAPGVVRVIPADLLPEETFDGPLTLQNFLATYPEIQFGGDSHPEGIPHYDPASRTLAEMAKEVTLRREIFCYEFAFKPLRQIIVDVPQPGSKMKRKLLWYMVYRLRYNGGDLRPSSDIVAGVPIFRRIEQVHYSTRRCNPSLVLHDHTTGNEYMDRVLPGVINQIKTREQITAPLHNTVEISQLKIPYSEPNTEGGVWGVATWEDVDPEIDFLSIDVYGLTNAFEQDGDGQDAAYRRKVLRLNFFRPGDTIDQTEDLIRFGVPAFTNPDEESYILKQYGLEKKLDYDWIFR